jgi:hypothetical protein
MFMKIGNQALPLLGLHFFRTIKLPYSTYAASINRIWDKKKKKEKKDVNDTFSSLKGEKQGDI